MVATLSYHNSGKEERQNETKVGNKEETNQKQRQWKEILSGRYSNSLTASAEAGQPSSLPW